MDVPFLCEEKLINVHVTDRNKERRTVTVPTDMGLNLMEMLRGYDFPVEGTCGGMALCASCQIYIHSNHPLPEKSEDEEAMLSEANYVTEKSRLGCQIPVSQSINGIEIELVPNDK